LPDPGQELRFIDGLILVDIEPTAFAAFGGPAGRDRVERCPLEERNLDVACEDMEADEPTLAFDGVERRVPSDRFAHLRDRLHDERIELFAQRPFPARHGRDVSLDRRVPVGLGNLRIATGEEFRGFRGWSSFRHGPIVNNRSVAWGVRRPVSHSLRRVGVENGNCKWGLGTRQIFFVTGMHGMPDVPEPGGDLKRMGVSRDRFSAGRLGERGDRHAELPVAMVEFADEDLFVLGHNDSADDSIPLADHPGGVSAIATGGHASIPFAFPLRDNLS